MKRFVCLLFIASLSLLLIGCGLGNDDPVDSENNGEVEEDNDNGEENEEETVETISLFFMDVTETDFRLAEETRDVEDPTPFAVMELLAEGPTSEDLDPVFPEGTEILGVDVEQGVAYVDFSSELTHAHFGSEYELRLVQATVYTMVQFDDIDQVQILVEGEKISSVAGHVDAMHPIGVEDI